jgi:hypothetical protein
MSGFNPEMGGDAVVAGALRSIAVPDHGPGFWDELADRIAGAPPVAGVHRLEPARAGRPLRVLAAAAVLAAVVGLAGLLATRNGGDEPSGIADPATTTTETSTTDAPETTTTVAGREVESPDEAVLRWVEALGRGDVDAAAARTGPRTRAAIEGRGGDLEQYLTVAQEGFGAWEAVANPMVTEVEIGEVDGETFGIVVLSGQRASEGQVEERHDALPVVLADDGRWLVEPAALPGDGDRRIVVTSPSASPGAIGRDGLAPGDPVEASAPGDGTFWFSIDGDGPYLVEGEPAGDRRLASFAPGRVSSGTHLLVIAYLDGGILTAFADTFLVEG